MPAHLVVALLDEGHAYARLQAKEASAAAERASVPVEIVYAENNAVAQIHQLFARIHAPEGERPAAIVVQSVTGEGLERVARNAVAAGIGWILLNRRVSYVAELRQAHPNLPIALVTPDQVEIGRIQGRQVLALAPDGGLLLYVQGPPDTSAAQDRLRGSEETLKDGGFQWKLLNGDWTEASSAKAVAGWLRLATSGGRLPAVIAAQNDEMAIGARRAGIAHQARWRGVPVIGCDGLPEHGLALVKSGEMAATVILPPSAGPAVELATQWLRDGRPLPAEVVLAPRPFPDEGKLARR